MANLCANACTAKTYFNVNRHINPTDVCVASCRLVRVRQEGATPRRTPCRWKRSGSAPAKAGARRSPNSTSWADCTRNSPSIGSARCSRGLKQRYPDRAPEGVHDGGDRLSCPAHQDLHSRDAGASERCRHGFAARRRRRNLLRARATHHLRSQDRWQRVDRDGAHRPPDRLEDQLHHAVRPPGEDEDRADHLVRLRAATGRNPRVRDVHSAGLPSRQYALAPSPKTTGLQRYEKHRHLAPDARQHSAHQSLLGDDDAAASPRSRSASAPTTSTARLSKKVSITMPAPHRPGTAAPRTSATDSQGRSRAGRTRHHYRPVSAPNPPLRCWCS